MRSLSVGHAGDPGDRAHAGRALARARRAELLDQQGVRVAEVDSRLRRIDLPLIVGEGRGHHVPEALALFAEAAPIAAADPRAGADGRAALGPRARPRPGDRLPEEAPVEALGRVMALHAAEDLLGRDLTVVDLRDPRRPVLRLTGARAGRARAAAVDGRGRGCMRVAHEVGPAALRGAAGDAGAARGGAQARRGRGARHRQLQGRLPRAAVRAERRGRGEPEGRRTLTQGAFRVIGAANTRSRGVRFGEIAEMEETERAVRTAIQAAQKMANLRVDHVIVGFSGGRPRSYGCTGEAEVRAGEVAERDIGAALAACELPDYGQDREAIHALPVNFVLDHRTGLTDPRGQIGARLAVDMHMLTVGPCRDPCKLSYCRAALRPRARRRRHRRLCLGPLGAGRGRAGARGGLHRHRGGPPRSACSCAAT
jgi:hypothetical protein